MLDNTDDGIVINLVLAGPAVEGAWLRRQLAAIDPITMGSLAAPQRIIIAADGGVNILHQLNLLPHYWVGDGDSSQPAALAWLTQHQVPQYRYATKKDRTDGRLAWQLAQQLCPKIYAVRLWQALGGRLDQLLAALGLVSQISKQLVAYSPCLAPKLDGRGSATICSPTQTITILPPMGIELHAPHRGSKFSLQAYGGTVENLNIWGAEYSLEDFTLELGDDLTISNHFDDQPVYISWQAGELLLWLDGEGVRWQRIG